MKKVLSIASVIISIIAAAAVSSASFVWIYQPKAPKCIMK